MRKHLLVIFAHFLAFSAMAQQDRPAVLVSAQGKIQYISPDNKKPSKVRAGAVLKPTGNLKLSKDAKAILYCDGQFIVVKSQGDHPLNKTCSNGGGGQSLGFEYDFGNYVLAGVEFAEYAHGKGYNWIKTVTDPKTGGDGWGTGVSDPKTGSSGWGTGVSDPKTGSSGWGNAVSDPKTGSSGWGTGVSDPKTGSSGWGTGVSDPKTGSSGWGTKNARIIPILPFGRVTASNTTFFWSNPGSYTSFHFEILDELNHTVFGIDLRDSFLQVNLNAVKLNMGSKYHWKVSVPGNNSVNSAELSFEIASEEKRASSLKKVDEMPLLQAKGDIALRRMAEAVALERDGWYSAAYETYTQVQHSNPNNLTRMMSAAFWTRYGLPPMAEKAASKL